MKASKWPKVRAGRGHQIILDQIPLSRFHLEASKNSSIKRLINNFIILCSISVIVLKISVSNAANNNDKSLPDLASSTSDEPVVALVGQDAYLSCVAKNLQNYTIIWRLANKDARSSNISQEFDTSGQWSIISAGRQRVTSDERFSILQSHETWILKISNVKLSDTGAYLCQTNSEPKVSATRILNIIKPNNGIGRLSEPRQDHFNAIDHNFTECCRQDLVSSRCQRLCSFQQLASRYHTINLVHECYSTLPSITRCMVAGRNVTDCCQTRHIPAKCHSMCGQSTDISALSVQDQAYCADYSATIMSCVAEGISTLPGQPELVIVEALSPATLKVSWQKVTDESELNKLDGWIVQLSKLSSFEDTLNSSDISATKLDTSNSQEGNTRKPTATPALSNFQESTLQVNGEQSWLTVASLLEQPKAIVKLELSKNSSEITLDKLKPYTVYQVQMYAFNSRGRSQLSEPIRALTLAPDEANNSAESADSASSSSGVEREPSLPDTRECCRKRGVSLTRCLDSLCDPVEADRASVADLMICAPWSNITFGCLSSHTDHTDCCRARGVSPFCLSMCAGQMNRVDHRHFRCLAHMSSYTNCILESHDVLASPPQNFTIGPITSSWAVLSWRAPKRHWRSLHGYRIFWRRLNSGSLKADDQQANGSRQQLRYSTAEAATYPYLLDALQADSSYEAYAVAVNKFGQSEPSARFVFQTPPTDQSELQTGSDIEARLPDSANAQSSQLTPNNRYNETGCCSAAGVSGSCLQLCDYNLKVSDAPALVAGCSNQMPAMLRCLAAGRNSVPCCRKRGVRDRCLNVCAGLSELSPLAVAARCASDFGPIVRCLDEGSKLIPGAPQQFHATQLKPDKVILSWKPAPEDSLKTNLEYHIRYQRLELPSILTSANANNTNTTDPDLLALPMPLHPLQHDLIMSTNSTEATIDQLRPNSRYSLYVTAENSYGMSLPSLVLVIHTPSNEASSSNDDHQQQQQSKEATLGAPHALEVLRSDTETIVLKWLAPLFVTSDADLSYRVFYKLLGPSTSSSTANLNSSDSNLNDTMNGQQATAATSWTSLETSANSITLRQLKYSSQYAIAVQAFSKSLLGHLSEVLLANTAKPVPPTLNQPLIINAPIEGNNITVMCVALGQPTPQISMFINGLLVQKRTQPYVIYHLVNLVRGQLTITCFAANGHGKDYSSVQSRTEVSVKFAARASSKSPTKLQLVPQSTSRLSCEITGNPQPTVIWTFTPDNQTSHHNDAVQTSTVLVPNERISTLLISQYENPFTWTHTLTIRNVSIDDSGTYQCRARNQLAESTDSLHLNVADLLQQQQQQQQQQTNNSQVPYLKLVEQSSDLMQCCRQQNVSSKCLPVCSVDGLDVEAAFKTAECQPHLDKLMYCAADGSDHRQCCRTRQIPATCLRWCSGAKLNIPALCFLSSAIDINQCFQEGRNLLPGPPRNVRVLLASKSEHSSERDLPTPNSEVATMIASSGSMFSQGDKQPPTMSNNNNNNNNDLTNSNGNNNNNNNNDSNSVISSMVMMMSDHGNSGSSEMTPIDSSNVGLSEQTQKQQQQQSEPLVIEWDPPAKNPSLVQYYRIFWRPFGSRELSRTVTNLTWIKLNDLNMNKIYEFVVKAANNHGASVYSDPLTVKPAEILALANPFESVGLIWFMPSNNSTSLLTRVFVAICFATLFMFTSLALVMFLERRGYLKRFASSKTNSSRVSFANPAYLKDSDGNQDRDNITWDSGHSLDVLAPPPHSQPQSTIN